MEETGLDVRPDGVLVVAEDVFPKEFHKKKHFIYFEVICHTESTDVKLDNDELQEYAWFGLEEAARIMDFPIVRRTILTYLKQKKNGKVEFIDIDKGV
jgi:8-oxo-dGTP pyrophosphatase MutT (NUDIX family)